MSRAAQLYNIGGVVVGLFSGLFEMVLLYWLLHGNYNVNNEQISIKYVLGSCFMNHE